MSDGDFESLLASVDPAMIVVTTTADGTRAGCLVGFHAQSSISAQHYSVWLSKANHTYRVGLRATHFAVHFLTSSDLALAEHFGTQSGEDVDKFADLHLVADDTGVPLIGECANRIVLERIAVLDDGGDHVCVTTRVHSTHSGGDFAPLRLSDVVHLDPGHDSEERAIKP